MPELPEVEIVRKSLSKNVTGKIVTDVRVYNRNLRFKLSKDFRQQLINKRIKQIDRFSKYLIFIFTDNSYCVIHLGMSGTIHLSESKLNKKFTNTSFYHSPHLPEKHNHVEMKFKDLILIYNDPRRFGYILFFKNRDELIQKFKNYGPEPFSKKFNLKYIQSYFKNKNKNIKNYLLDQKFVSGIGNIYASEILFEAKINPVKQVNFLSVYQINQIIKNSKKVLKKSIFKGGSSIRDFKNITGGKGSYQNEFKVYDRENLNCLHKYCKGTIKKIVISNRSSFFCNKCQK